MTSIIFSILQVTLVPLLSPALVGVVRAIKARLQNRTGASILQPYFDLWKLFHKDEVVSEDASWISAVAPYVVFGVTLVVGASIPLLSGVFISPIADVVTIAYILAIGVFFLALSGIDTGGGFGGFGASREMTLAALTEAGLIFSLLALAFVAHSTNLSLIAHAVASEPFTALAPVALAFCAFLIAMLAECARFPFDNPATHLELTMIHEAMILEYSGKKLALMEWASSNTFLIFLALGANLFFPWGLLFDANLSGLAPALAAFLAKVLVLGVFVAVIESTIAKFRFFRLPDLLFSSFVLSVIAISIAILI